MKIAVHRGWGIFYLPEEVRGALGCEEYEYDDYMKRNDEKLIAALEKYNTDREIMIIDIPNEATDWVISDYDGVETIYYCLDGKIYST